MNVTCAKVKPWEDFVRLMRNVPLVGDASTHPYEQSTISRIVLNIDQIQPLSLYALCGQVDRLAGLEVDLRERCGIDLFDLEGIVEFTTSDGVTHRMSPPVVETGIDNTYILVDGLHRCIVARKLGRDSVCVAAVDAVKYPLIAMPVEWDDVLIVNKVPEPHLKRRYRHVDANSWRRSHPEFGNLITDTNANYFFYRDLSLLGSSGPRGN
jgi:hypothetical protein